MIRELRDRKIAENLFTGWEEGCVWSAVQGIMGDVYVTDGDKPESGAVILGDFTFFKGKPDKELVTFKPEGSKKDFMIMVPENDEWCPMIEECFGKKAKKVTRYAIKKERDIFCREKLEQIVAGLSKEYTIRFIDEELYNRCMQTDWCRDGVANYPDYEQYRQYGLGVVILKDDAIVSSCSSYSGFEKGIEIEVDTREDYRRKGLACVCAARLILECLDRGWFPSWDAQNKMSVGLSEKLGYHFDKEYTAYEIWGY